MMLGCAAATTGPDPEGAPRAGVPIGRSNHLRSGHFSYRLREIHQDGNRVRVDIDLSNGTHRDYSALMIRVILFGEVGEIRAVRLPAGAIRAEQTKPLVARIDDAGFAVRDVTLELVYAAP